MAFITPVTNRTENSRTTATDMNRIVHNLKELGMTFSREEYTSDDIVRQSEWQSIVSFSKAIDPSITSSTRWDNLNRIEGIVNQAQILYPANNLYPANDLYPLGGA